MSKPEITVTVSGPHKSGCTGLIRAIQIALQAYGVNAEASYDVDTVTLDNSLDKRLGLVAQSVRVNIREEHIDHKMSKLPDFKYTPPDPVPICVLPAECRLSDDMNEFLSLSTFEDKVKWLTDDEKMMIIAKRMRFVDDSRMRQMLKLDSIANGSMSRAFNEMVLWQPDCWFLDALRESGMCKIQN